ncbi:protein of unknown function [Methanoculleus bourgensis]|uniref:Translation initiation factor IF2/IF5 domain-containing protein n=1 Tax=Methanoculleus bourgensis TaxID=83986 RepID=A0A0X3BM37_9EURY|nr:protein of unknown function [Methanoculleus bourgensis]
MTQSYEDLLKKAYTNITEPTEAEDRFIVPTARAFIEGKTTVLENFAEIASTLRRDQEHLMKHLLGELGTAGKIEGTRAVFSGKFEQEQINAIIHATSRITSSARSAGSQIPGWSRATGS